MRTNFYSYLEGTRPTLVPSTPELELWLEPARSAVLCIDMHRGHIGPEDQLTCPAPRARDRIAAHDDFHAAARALGVPIVHVQHWQRYGGIDDRHNRAENHMANWRILYDLYLPPNPLMDEHSWEGTPWLDLMVEVGPDDLFVRTKKRLSGFYPTDLEFLLRQLNVLNVVITGTNTDACCLSTAFDAANRDLRVLIPRDVVAGTSQEAEDAALLVMSLHAGLVVDGAALIAEWAARLGRPVPATPHLAPLVQQPAPAQAAATAATNGA